jgi:hypothetical protein
MIKIVNGFKNAVLVLIIIVAGHVLLPVAPPSGGRRGARLSDAGNSWHDSFYGGDAASPEQLEYRRLRERTWCLGQPDASRRQQQEQQRQQQQRQQQQLLQGQPSGLGECDGIAPRGASLRVLPPYPSLSAGSRASPAGRDGSFERKCAEELHRFVSEGLPRGPSSTAYAPELVSPSGGLHALGGGPISGPTGGPISGPTGGPLSGSTFPPAFPADERERGGLQRGSPDDSLPPAVDGSFEDTSSWFSPL